MPAKLVTGEDAQDVAAYVACAAAKPGEDTGPLAAAGVKRSTRDRQGGRAASSTIPADPDGQLAYTFG